MAWYEVSTEQLAKAGDKIVSFAGDLDVFQEKLGVILSELPEKLGDFQKHKKIAAELMDMSASANRLGQTLTETAEIYSHAERTAFADDGYAKPDHAPQPPPAPRRKMPTIRQPQSVLLFGDLIMPDWLQAAVLRYEQYKGA